MAVHEYEATEQQGRSQSGAGEAPWRLRGELPSHGLARLLLQIAERRLTGQLLLGGEGVQREISFAAGHPVFARSSRPEERLGALALDAGLVNSTELARAVTHAVERDTLLGAALLDLAMLNGPELFSLLGLQLRRQLGAACLEADTRVAFVADRRAAERVTVLYLHPLTAALAAIDALPPSDRVALLVIAGELPVTTSEFSEPASRWLRDLGYGAVPSALLAPRIPLSSLCARLAARIAPVAINATSSDAVPHAGAVPTGNGANAPTDPLASSQDLAERITLALLLSGALKVDASSTQPQTQASDPDIELDLSVGDHVGAIRSLMASEGFVGDQLPEAEAKGPGVVGHAVYHYLGAARDPELAAQIAVWGAAAEVADAGGELNDLLLLYLTLKPQMRPGRALAFEEEATRETAPGNHADYRRFLGALRGGTAGPLLHAKIGELVAHLDRALSALTTDAASHDGSRIYSDVVPRGSELPRGGQSATEDHSGVVPAHGRTVDAHGSTAEGAQAPTHSDVVPSGSETEVDPSDVIGPLPPSDDEHETGQAHAKDEQAGPSISAPVATSPESTRTIEGPTRAHGPGAQTTARPEAQAEAAGSEAETRTEPEPQTLTISAGGLAQPESYAPAEPEPQQAAEPEPQEVADAELQEIAEPEPQEAAEPEPQEVAGAPQPLEAQAEREPPQAVTADPEPQTPIEAEAQTPTEPEAQAVAAGASAQAVVAREPQRVPEPEAQAEREAPLLEAPGPEGRTSGQAHEPAVARPVGAGNVATTTAPDREPPPAAPAASDTRADRKRAVVVSLGVLLSVAAGLFFFLPTSEKVERAPSQGAVTLERAAAAPGPGSSGPQPAAQAAKPETRPPDGDQRAGVTTDPKATRAPSVVASSTALERRATRKDEGAATRTTKASDSQVERPSSADQSAKAARVEKPGTRERAVRKAKASKPARKAKKRSEKKKTSTARKAPAPEGAKAATKSVSDASADAPQTAKAPGATRGTAPVARKTRAKAPPRAKPKVPRRALRARAGVSNLKVQGSLPTSVVKRALARGVPEYAACYKSAAERAKKNVFAPVPVSFEVDFRGRFKRVRTGKGALPGLAPCVGKVTSRLATSRKPDIGTVRASFQLKFSP